MVNIEKINWDKLKSPHPLFKIFKPDEKDPIEFYKKVGRLKKMLKEKHLYLSDEYRHDTGIEAVIHNYFSNLSFNIFYEIGGFQGLLGFLNILPEFKCGLTLKLWDKQVWSKEFVRASEKLLDLYINEFKLKKISTRSPDEKIVRMAEMVGFEVEGEQPYEFKWKGKFYTDYLLGKIKEN